MKALGIFLEAKKVEIVDHAEPPVSRPTDVKLRMLEVGICGTDKEIASFEYGTPPAGSSYLVLGHEALGEVVEVGREVSDLRPGDLVVPMVRRPCPHARCPACRSGHQDFCTTGDFTERGIKGLHGFATELVVNDRTYMQRVPAELREVAVLIEPLTIAEKAMRQVWDVQERLPWTEAVSHDHGYRALVLGAGPVGLLGAMVLAHCGFETCVYSREPASGKKASVVRQIGGRYISAGDVETKDLLDATGDVDLVYEATGASRLAFDVMEILAPNAVYIFTGVPGRKSPIEVDTARLMRDLVLKNQVVFGTVNAGRGAFEAGVRDLRAFLERWPEGVRSLITSRRPLEAYAELLPGGGGGIKNVLTVS